jgi:hypothetical protein
MRPVSVSPDPVLLATAHLRRVAQRCCSPSLARTVQITGTRVVFPWPVVRAIQVARDIRLSALVAELRRYGDVLADDEGLLIMTPRS